MRQILLNFQSQWIEKWVRDFQNIKDEEIVESIVNNIETHVDNIYISHDTQSITFDLYTREMVLESRINSNYILIELYEMVRDLNYTDGRVKRVKHFEYNLCIDGNKSFQPYLTNQNIQTMPISAVNYYKLLLRSGIIDIPLSTLNERG